MIFEHALSFYKVLVKKSKNETIDGVSVRVFRGKLTETYSRLGISMSYYSKIMRFLQDVGNMTILERGSRGRLSAIVLHREPEEAEWENWTEKGLTRPADLAILAQRVDNAETMLGGINVVELGKDFEKRISKLEREVKKFNGKK